MQKCTKYKLNIFMKIKTKWKAVKFACWGLKLIYQANPQRTTFVLIIKLLESLLGPILVWLSAKIIDGLLKNHQAFFEFGPIFWMVVIFVGLTIFIDLLAPIVEMNKKLLTAQIQKYIDELLINKANTFEDIAPFDDQNFYTKVKVVRYNEYFVTLWLEMTANTFGGIVQIIAGSILIWTVIPFVPFIFIILAFPKIFVEAKLNNVTFEGREEVQELRRRAEYYVSIPLNHELVNEVKMYNLTAFFKEKYKNVTNQLIKTLSHDQKKLTLHNIGWGFLEAIVSGLVLIIIVKKAVSGTIAIGDLLLFIGALFQIREGVNELFSVFAIGAREMVNVRNIATFISYETPKIAGTLSFPSNIQKGFRLENIRFSYQKGEDVLNIDRLVIPEGKVTVLVGENGSGKSTLVKLLLKLYEPISGTIYFNEQPLNAYDTNVIRMNSTAVFQDFVRYEMNLKSNIAVGDINHLDDMSLIQNSAHLGGADKLASQLPEDYETELGRFFGGINLSGGQWQRIAMARAFMKDESAKILIFDEPTSALDPFMEYEIFTRLKQLGNNKTVIIISHQLSTAKLADHVVLLQQGEVIEYGNHHALMEHGGVYAELYNMQAAKYREVEKTE
ncbi:ABC transporter ATP-binding protein [Bacillus pseudomycoides]|uniref:ABC transporter ATP-binding protein n=1 Tax=Bacillus pseudomycoides TaxID=64104 RepID=UPI0023DA2C19|nr:ABC transporter ATP-binding protein [Bacillus pseudomycoides]MDF2084801.1 ABC transporter ATP-binding protein [Bacillus pseudomycoides]